jgi:hypothetical protein
MVAMVYLTALIPAPLTAYLRVNLYTLAITAFAVFQFRLLRYVSKVPA